MKPSTIVASAVTAKKVLTIPVERVKLSLDLSVEDAYVLAQLASRVAGSPTTSARGLFDDLRGQLGKAGINTDLIDSEMDARWPFKGDCHIDIRPYNEINFPKAFIEVK